MKHLSDESERPIFHHEDRCWNIVLICWLYGARCWEEHHLYIREGTSLPSWLQKYVYCIGQGGPKMMSQLCFLGPGSQ
jgi:hypothetical protein